MLLEKRSKTTAVELTVAYSACRDLAVTNYENFSVASRLIQRDLRPHFYAIYAFCRLVDDIGDEFEGDRYAQLDHWQRELESCYGGAPDLVWFRALQHTIETFEIPSRPFLRLIEANRRDQSVNRYETYDELVEYCTYSAAPVGHLVLHLYGKFTGQMARHSDSTCIALQLTNFWQDVGRDHSKGRIYIPQEDMRQFGVEETQIHRREPNTAFRELMEFEVNRSRDLFQDGYRLIEHLGDGFRNEFAAITRGGLAVLDAIEAQAFDTLTSRPTVSKTSKARILASVYIRNFLGLELVPRSSFEISATK